MMEQRYPYDINFQERVITHLLLDPPVLKGYRDVLSPQYFEVEEHRMYVKLILDYYDKYNTIPNEDALHSLILDYCRSINQEQELKSRLLGLHAKVYNNTLYPTQQIIDNITPFGRRQAMKLAYLETAPMIDDLEKNEIHIRQRLMEAFQVGSGISGHSFDFMQIFQDIPAEYRAFHQAEASARIPTGMSGLDTALDGGLGLYEVGMLEALPGYGKTRLMVSLAVVASLMLKNVLVISNELHELDFKLMLACRYSGLTAAELRNPDYQPYYVELMNRTLPKNNFIEFEYYPPFRMTTVMLRGLISKIENIRGQHVDIIILDMFDRIGGIDPRNPYVSQYFLIKELMAVVADYNTRLWTTTHVGTSGYNAEILDMKHKSGSVAKPQDVDIFMSLNQTEKQLEEKIAYINLAKIRRSEAVNRRQKIYFDKGRCLALSWDDWYKYQLSLSNSK